MCEAALSEDGVEEAVEAPDPGWDFFATGGVYSRLTTAEEDTLDFGLAGVPKNGHNDPYDE